MLDVPEKVYCVDGDSESSPSSVSPMLLLHSNVVSIPAVFASSPCVVSDESGTLHAESEFAGDKSSIWQLVLPSIRCCKTEITCKLHDLFHAYK